MNTSGLSRHLSTQGSERSQALAARMLRGRTIEGNLKQAALEQLTTIPEPWLDKMVQENLAFVALGYGESLADTEILRGATPETLKDEASRVRALRAQAEAAVDQEIATVAKDDPSQGAFAQHSRPELLAKTLGESLASDGLGFEVRVMRQPQPLEYLFNEMGVDDGDHDYLYPDGANEEARETRIFESLLTDLNGAGVLQDGAVVDPSSDVLVVPYKMKDGKRVSPVSLESYSSVNGQKMDNNHGMHVWPNRLIVVDDEVVNIPSRKMGYHSVLLHESGHAIDYMAEGIAELHHRETVDSLFERDIKSFRDGNNEFLTPRSMENVREYFAEAVEAYLTMPVDSPGNFYKPENNQQQLKERKPELYAYLDKVMRWAADASGSTEPSPT